MGAEADAMLALMRAGVPNAEILVAKGLDDMLALAARHNVTLPMSSTLPLAEEAEAVEEEEMNSPFDVRRYTKPPSYYEARSAAPSRRRHPPWQNTAADGEVISQFGSPTSLKQQQRGYPQAFATGGGGGGAAGGSTNSLSSLDGSSVGRVGNSSFIGSAW